MQNTNDTVIKGGYFNVSTKPAEPRVDTIAWGTPMPSTKKVVTRTRTRLQPAPSR